MQYKDNSKPVDKQPLKQTRSKEDVIREMIEKDPEKAAQMLREILKGK